jgi:hypothetical protein
MAGTARKTPIDAVAEAREPVAVDEIQRLLETLPDENAPPIDDRDRKISQFPDPWPPEDVPAGTASPWRLRGPIVNAVLPRGGFP